MLNEYRIVLLLQMSQEFDMDDVDADELVYNITQEGEPATIANTNVIGQSIYDVDRDDLTVTLEIFVSSECESTDDLAESVIWGFERDDVVNSKFKHIEQVRTLILSEGAKLPHSYNVGDCVEFAIALHQLTNAPLVSIARKKLLPEEAWYGDEENDKYDFEHAHCGVLIGYNVIADANGIHEFEPGACNCLWSIEGENVSEPYLEEMGDDVLLLESYYAKIDDEIIERATDDILRWGYLDVVKWKMKELGAKNG